MIKRELSNICFKTDYGRQMRFVVGPRQCGKTTIAKNFLCNVGDSKFYYNWDTREIRNLYREDPYFAASEVLKKGVKNKKRWICFDEIHKMHRWKNILKDYFDRFEDRINFIITGSARLDMLRFAGDSLAGRYFVFKLTPLTLREAADRNIFCADEIQLDAMMFIEKQLSYKPVKQAVLETLLLRSGFPEPFLQDSALFQKKWHQSYLDRLLRDDLRDLTNVRDLEKIGDLILLFPQKITSPLSVNSLTRDLEVSYTAVKNYLKVLELAYIFFSVPPYSKRISRSIKKEKKYYFYDWTRVKDESKRFENYVAVELTTLINLWNELSENNFSLFYVRNRMGQETDFLITMDDNPWLLIEVKHSEENIASHHLRQAHEMGGCPFVQIVKKKGIVRTTGKGEFIISAASFFV